jgi:hypothetical protein
MKTNLSFAMNPATNEALVPPEMLRAGSATVRSVIDIMMLYGIDKIEVGHYAHGSVMLLSPKLRAMTHVDIPAWLDGSRKQAIYHLGHLMIILGLLGVEIILDDNETKAMVERWRSCERLSNQTAAGPESVAQLLAPEGGVQIENPGGN